jgi:hypothetical protein
MANQMLYTLVVVIAPRLFAGAKSDYVLILFLFARRRWLFDWKNRAWQFRRANQEAAHYFSVNN